ncbi:MAG: PDR/VanB family oxidoreductase [Nocardioides sp.]|uniref:PDR/VanB family oxidoreductase n=1 Tax=Nocardioides sp. TaxID=35761 RepID=UPI0039E3DB25
MGESTFARDASTDVLDVIVRERVDVADGVALFRLADVSGAPLPPWTPGAHVDLVLPGSIVRQYSLCGTPADRSTYEIAVLREAEGRGGSRTLVDRVSAGLRLGVRGPRNHFSFESAPAYRFVAGGIGITPILPMIAEAEAAGADWELLYGGRRLESMAMANALVDRYGDRVLLRPQDRCGVLDLDEYLADLPLGALIYACGPEALLDALVKRSAVWPAGTLHLERFAAKVLDGDVIDTEFEVELARTGVTVVVPAGRSILEVVEEAGAFVLTSCTEGTCGSCETAVLGGVPDHRDSVLDDAARVSNESMMVCVSRCSSGRLVLDL